MTVPPPKSKGRKRLMALGDYVEQQSRDRKWREFFNMASWFSKYSNVIAELNLKEGDVMPINGGCGTAACMLGHAPNVPMLKRLGLKAVVNDFGCVDFYLGGMRPDALEVCNDLFGIDGHRVGQIFGRRGYSTCLKSVTPMQAVRQLRKIVKEIDSSEGWLF